MARSPIGCTHIQPTILKLADASHGEFKSIFWPNSKANLSGYYRQFTQKRNVKLPIISRIYAAKQQSRAINTNEPI